MPIFNHVVNSGHNYIKTLSNIGQRQPVLYKGFEIGCLIHTSSVSQIFKILRLDSSKQGLGHLIWDDLRVNLNLLLTFAPLVMYILVCNIFITYTSTLLLSQTAQENFPWLRCLTQEDTFND